MLSPWIGQEGTSEPSTHSRVWVEGHREQKENLQERGVGGNGGPQGVAAVM